jgi:Tol biopolymer transport system component
VYFTRSAGKTDASALFQVALPGSASRKLLDGVDSPISFSPSGDRFAFVRWNRAGGEYSLMIANVDGTGERTIATRRDGNRLSIDGPAWSPDEKSIVCGAGWWDRSYHMDLVEVEVADGHEKPIGGRQQWFAVYQVTWLEDKSGLILSAREQPLSPAQLWRVSYPRGETARITSDTTEYSGASLSWDGNTIVSVQSHQVSQIWVAPDADLALERAVASKVGVSYGLGLSWTSKGKIVFSSTAGNNVNISAIDPDGSNQTPLTLNAADNYTPASSPDGRFIVFASNRAGGFNIWRMNADDGSELRQLTLSDGNFYPSCSPDGQWVFYEQQSKAGMSVWKVSINGGDPEQLTDKYSRMPVVSPDNQFIACRYYVEAGLRGIAIIPVHGGPPVRLLPIPVMEFQRVQWFNNGHAMTFVNTANGVSNIWSYDLDSGSTKQLTHFKTDQIFAYAWSPDYKQLVSERGTKASDATIINYQR